jgi:hypothetical protein
MRSRVFLVLIAAALVQGPAAAQDAARPWVVWKLSNASAEIVARFGSEAEAIADRKRRTDDNAEPLRHAYVTRREPAGGGTRAASPRGRRGEGAIGIYAVNIEFGNRTFSVAGKELEGTGTWSQYGPGAVTMETEYAIFRGLIDGDRVCGVRAVKDGSELPSVWAFRLEPANVTNVAVGGDAVRPVAGDEVKAYSAEKGKAVVGLVPNEKGDGGDIVTAVPGSKDRVWDGSTLGGFKDLADGKKVADDATVDRMGAFVREQFPNKDEAIKQSAENLRVGLLDRGEDPMEVDTKVAEQVRTDIRAFLDNATPEEKQTFFDLYAERGAPIGQLYRPTQLPRIQWYQVPANGDVRQTVREYQPPPTPPAVSTPTAQTPAAPTAANPPSPSNVTSNPPSPDQGKPQYNPRLTFRDIDFANKIGGLSKFGYDEKATKTPANGTVGSSSQSSTGGSNGSSSTAGNGRTNTLPPLVQPLTINFNNIGAGLKNQATQTQRTQPMPVIRPPVPQPRAPVYQPTPRQQNVVPKPGGVIITATANIDGLKPQDVRSASFDAPTGTLKLALSAGRDVTCKLDADDFAVAVRCVFDTNVDPSLSMSFGEKKGYKSVNYCGPLFKTRFGKVMYQTDETLGAIIFNREGNHRPIAASVLPRYEELVGEAQHTMMSGSRVFLRAREANFLARKDRLVCRDIRTKVDVEGSGYAADYFQESLHRLARLMDERFNELADRFDEFRDFRRLVHCVALAKWLKQHSITFDRSDLTKRTVTAVDIPALVPADEWSCLFNGRSLDGWHMNLNSSEAKWTLADGVLSLEPTRDLEMSCTNYSKNYEFRYTVTTEGPVEFMVRKGPGKAGASVPLDTQGRPAKVELFVADGAWALVAPGFGRQGSIAVPEPGPGEARQVNEVGIRVPAGSKLTLYTASYRGR